MHTLVHAAGHLSAHCDSLHHRSHCVCSSSLRGAFSTMILKLLFFKISATLRHSDSSIRLYAALRRLQGAYQSAVTPACSIRIHAVSSSLCCETHPDMPFMDSSVIAIALSYAVRTKELASSYHVGYSCIPLTTGSACNHRRTSACICEFTM